MGIGLGWGEEGDRWKRTNGEKAETTVTAYIIKIKLKKMIMGI